MSNMNRRNFLKLTTAATAAAATSMAASRASAKTEAHVVVIGGGVGGATFAKYMKMYSPETKVTIVEKNKEYQRPYGSSEVVVGRIDMKDITISYDALKNKHGINFVFDTATDIDYENRVVKTAGGTTLSYDRLVVSPGISYDYSAIPGMEHPKAREAIVSGWDSGEQLITLRNQLEAVPTDGTVVIVPPPNPYRCPPGPYERSGLIAQWFINRGDKNAKVIILDPKNGFTVDVTMLQAWNRLYDFNLPESFKKYTPEERATFKTFDKPGKIQWIPAAEGGRVVKIDADNKTVECEAGVFKADMINLIPPLKAGKIALDMGLADKSGWCPVDQKTFESTIHPNVHVIGDSSIAGQMPKSGYAANSQAKVVALQIKALLAGQPPLEPAFQNTCYALAGRDDYGMFVADFFRLKDGVITREKAPRYLPFNASDAQYRLSAVYLHAWMDSFTQDIFS